MTLGEKIKDARKRFGMSQEELACKLSVSRAAIAKWETDKGIPDIVNLKARAKLLQVSIDYLLNEEQTNSAIEIKESICLDDFEIPIKHLGKREAVVFAKYPNATAIYNLFWDKEFNRMEAVVDTVTFGALRLVEGLNNRFSKFYLVETDIMQYLIEVTNDYIRSISLESKITNKSFRYAGYQFTIGGDLKLI